MWNNCFIWAHWYYFQLKREWRRQGKPLERVPCIHSRPSRSHPNDVPHWIAGWWCYRTSTLEEARSFVPDKRHDVPWYLVWTRLFFKGHIKEGDNPSLSPSDEP